MKVIPMYTAKINRISLSIVFILLWLYLASSAMAQELTDSEYDAFFGDVPESTSASTATGSSSTTTTTTTTTLELPEELPSTGSYDAVLFAFLGIIFLVAGGSAAVFLTTRHD